ncbi:MULTISPECIES: S1 domain-containing RNA-binding protein [Paenibacillus]|uniref:S1 domain-containing RNA-binding protein n=1 Tax=Paenibacillus radicis (ex Xue et al. 2023) TaxID=2972489 RepID=A0ABT1YUG0_9BACL|nr:S1 domain-containing RNA-binding protein [Paenibacillus radicis (ex Xue et al. 2023)]MCR8636118.1 S1 domain-containing RNA-binding protein [Paenibacillus radicis (ex Xue et al. 2023)]
MAIEVGSKLEGKVTGITHFGAFVELPEGGTGLVHISEIADNYVKDVNDHLKLNDMVTVKVINVDKDGKIGLSIKQAVDKPVEAPRPPRFERQGGGPGGPGAGGGDRGGRPGGGFGGGGRGGGFGGGGGGDRGGRGGGFGGGGRGGKPPAGKPTFEDKVSRFLKDSEERISSLKKNTEGKRGGRGARRD